MTRTKNYNITSKEDRANNIAQNVNDRENENQKSFRKPCFIAMQKTHNVNIKNKVQEKNKNISK